MVILVLAAGISRANPGDPDLSNPVLIDGQIRHISGTQILSILPDPFPDNSLIGYWIAVRRYEDIPIEYYRIIANEHFDQWNISVFEIAEDLTLGGSQWWLYDEAFLFTIYAPEPPEVLSISMSSPGTYTIRVDEGCNEPCIVAASTDMDQWEPVATVTPVDGIIQFKDTVLTGNTCRFYQLMVP